MEKKLNKFSYEVNNGTTKGWFSVYQSKEGGIYIMMGACFTRLTKQQVKELGIQVNDLKDFDQSDFHRAYSNYTAPVAISCEEDRLRAAEPDLIKACRSTLEYLDVLYPDKTCCHPKYLIDQIKGALDKAGAVRDE